MIVGDKKDGDGGDGDGDKKDGDGDGFHSNGMIWSEIRKNLSDIAAAKKHKRSMRKTARAR